MSIFDDRLRRPGQLGDALYEGLGSTEQGSTEQGSTGLGSTAASAGSRRSTVNPTTEAILAQRANRTTPPAGTGVASQGQPPRQTRFSSTRTSIATPDRSDRTRDNSGTTGTTGRSGENGTTGRQAITAPIIAQSSTAAAPRATTAPAASVDDFLKGLMRDERYWKPGPDQAPYRDGIARLFQAAYPGPYTPGSFSRTAELATSVQDLQTLAGSFLPRQPERTTLLPEYDDFPTERPSEDILNRLPLRKNGLLYLILRQHYPDGIPETVERSLLTLTPGIPLADQPGLWPDQAIQSAAETTAIVHHEEDAVAGGAGNDKIFETIPKTDQPSDDGSLRNRASEDASGPAASDYFQSNVGQIWENLPSPTKDAVDLEEMYEKLGYDPAPILGGGDVYSQLRHPWTNIRQISEDAETAALKALRAYDKKLATVASANGGVLDAIRHATGMIMLTRELGAEAALNIGDRHERKPDFHFTPQGLPGEQLQDLYNNRVGIAAAQNPAFDGMDPAEIAIDLYRKGKLQTEPFRVK